MNKIYLRLKRDISVLVPDGNWSLHPGDMIVFQKIGIKSEIKVNQYKANEYIHSDSYLLTGFEYRTFRDIKAAFDGDPEYHMLWNECNSVDTLITISTGALLYHSVTYTYYDILKISKLNMPILGHKLTFDDIFEDVSITYNREDKLKEILNYDL